MARIRTIKPEYWTSEQVVDCSTTARLLFIGMWNFCDDAGIHPASAKTLKMRVFPGDDITTQDVDALVAELVAAGLITGYSVENQQFWRVTGWKHQRIDKPNYRYPHENGRIPGGENSDSGRRAVEESSPPEGNGMEGKGCKGDSTTSRRFRPPTADEVAAYVHDRGSGVDAQRFVDHYAAKGWKVGKTPMKDWRAAVRTWERQSDTATETVYAR